MKITEIYVSILYPYQLSQYQNGKIEIGEKILLEEGEDPGIVQTDSVKRIVSKCKEEIYNTIVGVLEKQTGERGERKRREFNV